MKKSVVFAAIAALVLTACGKKAEEATTETVVENAAETISANETVIPVTIVTENEVPKTAE